MAQKAKVLPEAEAKGMKDLALKLADALEANGVPLDAELRAFVAKLRNDDKEEKKKKQEADLVRAQIDALRSNIVSATRLISNEQAEIRRLEAHLRELEA